MAEALHIVVVGAGIVGVSAAERLRRDGHRVTLVDRVPPGDPRQTSYGNAGMIARCSVVPVPVPGLAAQIPAMLLDRDSPLFLRWSYLPRIAPWLVAFLRHGRREVAEATARALAPLVGDAVDQHLDLARGTGAEAHVRVGEYSYLWPDRAAFQADAFGMGLRRAHGFEWEERDRAALVEADPELGPAYGFGAVFRDHGSVLDPGAYVAALAAHFVAQGGTLRAAEVRAVTPLEGGRARVEIEGETIDADRAVIAAGVWSDRLTAPLGVDARMETERGYHLVLKNPSHTPPTPYMFADAKFVATPMTAGLRVAGLVEFGGLEAGPNQKAFELLRRRIRRAFPKLSWEDEDSWLGHRPSPVDSLPLLGQTPGAPGVYCAFGSHHIGLTMGPKLGRLTADLIAGRRPNIDLSPYRVGRFSA